MSSSSEQQAKPEIIHFNKRHRKPLSSWARAIAIRQTCHSIMADRYHYREKSLATISVALTALTSSAIFTSISPRILSEDTIDHNDVHHTTVGDIGMPTLAAETDGGTQDDSAAYARSTLSVNLASFAGMLAAVNTILQAVHKSLNYGQESEKHLIAFKQFTKMRYQLEGLVGNTYEDDGHIDEAALSAWVIAYGEVLESSPLIPQREFEKVRAEELEKEKEYDDDQRKKVKEEKDHRKKVEDYGATGYDENSNSNEPNDVDPAELV